MAGFGENNKLQHTNGSNFPNTFGNPSTSVFGQTNAEHNMNIGGSNTAFGGSTTGLATNNAVFGSSNSAFGQSNSAFGTFGRPQQLFPGSCFQQMGFNHTKQHYSTEIYFTGFGEPKISCKFENPFNKYRKITLNFEQKETIFGSSVLRQPTTVVEIIAEPVNYNSYWGSSNSDFSFGLVSADNQSSCFEIKSTTLMKFSLKLKNPPINQRFIHPGFLSTPSNSFFGNRKILFKFQQKSGRFSNIRHPTTVVEFDPYSSSSFTQSTHPTEDLFFIVGPSDNNSLEVHSTKPTKFKVSFLSNQVQNQSIFGYGGTTLFGSSNSFGSEQPFNNQFGQAKSLFGQPAQASAFGSVTNSGGGQLSAFGNSGGLFGSTSATGSQNNPLIGEQPSIAENGKASATTLGGFGFQALKAIKPDAVNNNASLFGVESCTPAKPTENSGFSFGCVEGNKSSSPAPVKYQPTEGNDYLFKNSNSPVYTKTKTHCITAMQEYQNKSLEELRLEESVTTEEETSNKIGNSKPAFGFQPSFMAKKSHELTFGSASSFSNLPQFGMGTQTFGSAANNTSNLFGSLTSKKSFQELAATKPVRSSGSCLVGQPSCQQSVFGSIAETNTTANVSTSSQLNSKEEQIATKQASSSEASTSFLGVFGRVAPTGVTSSVFPSLQENSKDQDAAKQAFSAGPLTGFFVQPSGQQNIFGSVIQTDATSAVSQSSELSSKEEQSTTKQASAGFFVRPTCEQNIFGSVGQTGATSDASLSSERSSKEEQSATKQSSTGFFGRPTCEQDIFGSVGQTEAISGASLSSEQSSKEEQSATKQASTGFFGHPTCEQNIFGSVGQTEVTSGASLSSEQSSKEEPAPPLPPKPVKKHTNPVSTSGDGATAVADSHYPPMRVCGTFRELRRKKEKENAANQAILKQVTSKELQEKMKYLNLKGITPMPLDKCQFKIVTKNPNKGTSQSIASLFTPSGLGRAFTVKDLILTCAEDEQKSPTEPLDNSNFVSNLKPIKTTCESSPMIKKAKDNVENEKPNTPKDSSADSDKSSTSSFCIVSDDGSSVVEEETHPNGIVSTRAGYYTIPSLGELNSKWFEEDSCVVPNLTIGRKGYGNVYFDFEIDVANLNLDEIVHFRNKEIRFYSNDKLVLGNKFKNGVQVTLDQVWPHDKIKHKPIKDPHCLDEMNYEDVLRKACNNNDTQFVEYIPQTGSWIFKIKNFTKNWISCWNEENEMSAN